MAGAWFTAPAFGHDSAVRESQAHLELSKRDVGWYDPTRVDPSPGRRLRCFATLVRPLDGNINAVVKQGARQPFLTPRRRLRYGEALHALENCRRLKWARE